METFDLRKEAARGAGFLGMLLVLIGMFVPGINIISEEKSPSLIRLLGRFECTGQYKWIPFTYNLPFRHTYVLAILIGITIAIVGLVFRRSAMVWIGSLINMLYTAKIVTFLLRLGTFFHIRTNGSSEVKEVTLKIQGSAGLHLVMIGSLIALASALFMERKGLSLFVKKLLGRLGRNEKISKYGSICAGCVGLVMTIVGLFLSWETQYSKMGEFSFSLFDMRKDQYREIPGSTAFLMFFKNNTYIAYMILGIQIAAVGILLSIKWVSYSAAAVMIANTFACKLYFLKSMTLEDVDGYSIIPIYYIKLGAGVTVIVLGAGIIFLAAAMRDVLDPEKKNPRLVDMLSNAITKLREKLSPRQ